MSNYLHELENEITLKCPSTYNKIRKIQSDHLVTSFGICIRSNPCWYICAEYGRSVITIDLYVIEERADFNEVIGSLTSSAPSNAKGVKRIHKYLVKLGKYPPAIKHLILFQVAILILSRRHAF
jgi:hypothetical protein